MGDVHGAWSCEEDAEALAWLAADVVLLVGDFGEEDLELVLEVATLPMPKAVMLGAAGSAFLLLLHIYPFSSPLTWAVQGTMTPGVLPGLHHCHSSKRVCTVLPAP